MHLACVLATALTIYPLSSSQGTTSSSDSATPAPTPAENTQTPPADQNQPVAQTESPKTDPARKAKGNPRKHRAKPLDTTGEPRKVVIHQGGISEPAVQIVPGITQEEANRQRENAEQLLAATDANLKRLAARTLTLSQQETTGQIRYYIDGARSALKDGDTRRAHTLAQKAYLLSDDLVKY